MAEQQKEQVTDKRAFSWVPLIVRSIIVSLSVCRLLPYETFLCVLLFSAYIYVMSRFAFPKQQGEPTKKAPSFVAGRKIFKDYIRLAAYVGLYFPFGYILLGVAMSHKEVVHTAAPHTFLLACQVLSERLSSSLSPPCLALVPILYNSGRMVSILAWLQADFTTPYTSNWVVVGRVLAIANLILWSYNLFGFLIPMYLPFCFRRYLEYENA